MDIIAGIGAATEGLKLIGELRKIDKEVDKADLKLRLVDVAERLFETRQALQDAQEREFALRQTISGLEAKLKNRTIFQDENGQLFELDEAGQRIGEPFCNLCFVKEDRQFRLRKIAASVSKKAHYRCDNCKTVIDTGPALPMPLPSPRTWQR